MNANSKKGQGLKWQEGLFFAGDPQNYAQWCSEAYTTAMSLEALAKYAMAYDKGGVDIMNGRRINIEQYTNDIKKDSNKFKFNIK